MDFFERQESARRHTSWLVVYFAMAVAGIVLATHVAVSLGMGYVFHARSPGALFNPEVFSLVTVCTVGLIVCGSVWKTAQLASGGGAVAELLGGRPVDSNTRDPDERKLLNIVEEISIASGTPVPKVYVLPNENGINAFAAGHTTGDMAVCATRGCVKLLTRDELQGVIGHEFSHILNGDMRLNLRLMGWTFGILCIAMFGRILLRVRSSGRDKNPLPLLGLALLVIGSLGVFFARLIKSAVSRQREELADASAVQFTRNPEGLAGALKKIGGQGSRIDDVHAEEASHLFFANGLSESLAGMFATHPPLDDRIRELDPHWDGKYIVPKVEEWAEKSDEEDLEEGMAEILGSPSKPVRPPLLGDLLGGRRGGLPIGPATIAAGGVLAQAGKPLPKHLEYAAEIRTNLPAILSAAAKDPMSAVALIYALLLSGEDNLRAQQLQQLGGVADAPIVQETMRLLPEVLKLDSRARLPLASLSMTALRSLSPAQYAQFSKAMQLLIESDGEIRLFEYVLQKIVVRQLERNYMPPKRVVVQYYALRGLESECAVLLSALARGGHEDPQQIEDAFQHGAAMFNLPDFRLLAAEQCGLQLVDASLERLNQATPQIKKVVLNACAETVAADGVIQENEAELLRAIAETLDCPIPPIVSV